MNSSAPSGNIAGAAVSVLPATAAVTLLPAIQLSEVAGAVVVFAGIWAISYVALSTTLRFIQK